MMIRHLDVWTAGKVRDAAHDPYAPLTREEINAYTVAKLKEQLLRAAADPQYKDTYKEYDIEAICQKADDEFMEDFRTLPPADAGLKIEVTDGDMARDAEYFNYAMRLISDPSDVVLLLVDCDGDDSIGGALARGIAEMGGKAVAYGLPKSAKDEADEIIKIIRSEGVTSIVALPTQMIGFTREAEREGMADYNSDDFVQLRSILLCGEYVPEETVMMLEEVYECCIYEMYGTKEMGHGCAISCGFGNGYHVREADLYLEIVDPRNGEIIRDGSYGELVFTKLSAEGTPVVRYRTGDITRWIMEPCMCGSQLRRIDKVGSKDIIKEMLVNKIHGIR